MNDIDPLEIPLLRFGDGTELFMTVQEIQRSTDVVWHMQATLRDVEPSRTAQAVVLVWRGIAMQAVVTSIIPHGGDEFLATIAFHPEHPVILP